MVIYYTKISQFNSKDISRLITYLPGSFHVTEESCTKRMKERMIGYYLLHLAIRTCGIFTEINIVKNSHGKPYLIGNEVYFNISHSNNIISIAIDDHEIGLDIEFAGNRNISLITSRFYHENEKKLLLFKNIENNIFYKIWTLKECYAKYLGVGLSYELMKIDMSEYIDCINHRAVNLNNVIFNSFVMDEGYLWATCSEAELTQKPILVDAKLIIDHAMHSKEVI